MSLELTLSVCNLLELVHMAAMMDAAACSLRMSGSTYLRILASVMDVAIIVSEHTLSSLVRPLRTKTDLLDDNDSLSFDSQFILQ
jgi:hypothetical protein